MNAYQDVRVVKCATRLHALHFNVGVRRQCGGNYPNLWQLLPQISPTFLTHGSHKLHRDLSKNVLSSLLFVDMREGDGSFRLFSLPLVPVDNDGSPF